MADNTSNKIQALLSLIKAFEPDCDNLYDSWHRWLSAFGHFLIAANIDVDKEQKSWMLLVGGASLQNVDLMFNNQHKQSKSNDKPVADVYKECTDRFSRYFYERDRSGKFKDIKQDPEESFENFLNRLLALLESCRFSKPQDELKMQISIGAKDLQVRTKAQESHIDVNEVIKYAKNMEKVERGLQLIRAHTKVREAENTEEMKSTEELTQPVVEEQLETDVDEQKKIEVLTSERNSGKDKLRHRHHDSSRSDREQSGKHRYRSRSPKNHRRGSRSSSHTRSNKSASRDGDNFRERHTNANDRRQPDHQHVQRQHKEYVARRRDRAGPSCDHCGRFNHVAEFCFYKN